MEVSTFELLARPKYAGMLLLHHVLQLHGDGSDCSCLCHAFVLVILSDL